MRCGSSVWANSAKAREKVDSCGICRTLFHPHKQRSCRSQRNRCRTWRVVSRPYTALARKAVAKAYRSFDGRPRQPRLQGRCRLSRTMPSTATNNCAFSPSAPTCSSTRSNNTVCKTCVNSCNRSRGVLCIRGFGSLASVCLENNRVLAAGPFLQTFLPFFVLILQAACVIGSEPWDYFLDSPFRLLELDNLLPLCGSVIGSVVIFKMFERSYTSTPRSSRD